MNTALKSFFSLCFFSVALPALSQQKIKRIGPIRLGMSYSALLDTLNLSKWSFIDPNFSIVREQDIQQANKNYRLYYDKEKSPDAISQYRKCGDALVLVLEKVTIPVSMITIHNVQLSFYKDSLVEVKIQDPSKELISLIKRRFGKGAERKEELLINCPYTYGGYTRKETLNVTAWGDTEGNTLNYINFNSVTKQCEVKMVSYVQFYSNAGLASLERCTLGLE